MSKNENGNFRLTNQSTKWCFDGTKRRELKIITKTVEASVTSSNVSVICTRGWCFGSMNTIGISIT